ncbi:zinc ribbon domain-containing protein [Clostridium sp. AM58-1XD]|uniref:zinc ribbon domain-containing protein n=1 Tax=Clostridium sp. AM58-1XD TaxID=2292307 RepID=UPI000E521A82|nr:zinc ribbon domain-containing protein [Clostridium sp. AM58-1XD]RGY99443.1 zinc ribbon domain-containing protein [Clostridium sp. AM58-1XD]
MTCKNCKREIPQGVKHCPYCGAKQDDGKKTGKITMILAGTTLIIVLIILVVLLMFIKGKDDGGERTKEVQPAAVNDVSQETDRGSDSTEIQASANEKSTESLRTAETAGTVGSAEQIQVPDEEQKEMMRDLTFNGICLLPYNADSSGEVFVQNVPHERMLDTYNYIAYDTGMHSAQGKNKSLYPESRWENQGIDGIQGWGYVSSDADAMKAFLKKVYGWSFEITDADAALGYAEKDGRIYGPGFGDGMDATEVDFLEPSYSFDEKMLTVTVPCEERLTDGSDRVVNRGERITTWTYNPASPVLYTMESYKERWDQPLYSWMEQEVASTALPSGQIEDEVKRIRAVYSKIQNEFQTYQKTTVRSGVTRFCSADGKLMKYSVTSGTDGSPWAREYYYENGNLIFAFYFQEKVENRFYFSGGTMFRWIDSQKQTHDNDTGNSSWYTWEDQVKSEAGQVQ